MTSGRRGLRLLAPALFALGGCNMDQFPPLSTAQDICTAQVQDCTDGVAMDGTCMGYGAPRPLTDTPKGTSFLGPCGASANCPDPNGAKNCLQVAQQRCQAPNCKLDPNSVQVANCTLTCAGPGGGGPPIGGGGGGGDGGTRDGGASDGGSGALYQAQSFQFNFSQLHVEQAPSRVTAIDPAKLGTPVAIDAAAFLDAVTNSPDNLLAYDFTFDPPQLGFPPQSLKPPAPKTLFAQDLPDVQSDTVVGNSLGVTLYDSSMASFMPMMPIVTRKTITLGPVVGLALDPIVCVSDQAVVLTKSPAGAATAVVFNSVNAPPAPVPLSGDPKGVTMDSSGNAWVLSKPVAVGGVVTRLAVPAGTKVGNDALIAGDPVGIGGGPAVDTNSFPGAIVVVVATANGGEFQEFFGGALNTMPQVFSLAADFPNALPVKAKIFKIGDKQYAWVALLNGMDNIVALYDLAQKQHLKDFDVHLNLFEPLAVTVGLGGNQCPPANPPDELPAAKTAYLHVLVKSH